MVLPIEIEPAIAKIWNITGKADKSLWGGGKNSRGAENWGLHNEKIELSEASLDLQRSYEDWNVNT